MSSIGSPRIAIPMAFPISKKQALLSKAIFSARKSLTDNSERRKTEVSPYENVMQDVNILRQRGQPIAQQHVDE